MKRSMQVATGAIAALLFLVLPFAHGDTVKSDYDHHASFSDYHTFTFGTIKADDPFAANRIKRAVTILLQQRGWTMATSGADVTIFATQNVHNQKEMQTMYDGMGGWGGGWGWGGWGWGGMGGMGGMGESNTTTYNQPVGHLVVDMFQTGSKTLLWRGVATGNQSSNANKDKKDLYGDIHKMFNDFPVKPIKKS